MVHVSETYGLVCISILGHNNNTNAAKSSLFSWSKTLQKDVKGFIWANIYLLFQFTWCLDACIREKFVDAKRARELQGFLDSMKKGQEQVLGCVSDLTDI